MTRAKLNHIAVHLLLQLNHLPSFSIYKMGMPSVFSTRNVIISNKKSCNSLNLKESYVINQQYYYLFKDPSFRAWACKSELPTRI